MVSFLEVGKKYIISTEIDNNYYSVVLEYNYTLINIYKFGGRAMDDRSPAGYPESNRPNINYYNPTRYFAVVCASVRQYARAMAVYRISCARALAYPGKRPFLILSLIFLSYVLHTYYNYYRWSIVEVIGQIQHYNY